MTTQQFVAQLPKTKPELVQLLNSHNSKINSISRFVADITEGGEGHPIVTSAISQLSEYATRLIGERFLIQDKIDELWKRKK